MFSVLVKAISLSICVTFLVACDNFENIIFFKSVGDPDLFQKDVVVGADRKSVDIEVNSSEETTLNALQASVLANLDAPFYRYLDASDFPADSATSCQNSLTDERSYGANFVASSSAGEALSEGEIVTIDFENCQLDAEREVNGSLAIRYTSVGGLNDLFMPISTEYCVAQLQEKLEEQANDTSFQSSEHIYYVSGHEVRFRPAGASTRVDVYEHSYDGESGERTDSLISSFEVEKNKRTIIVNEKLGVAEDSVVSLDGNEVFSSYEGEQEAIACQYYRRTMNVAFDNFSVKKGAMTTSYVGELELENITEDFLSEGFNIVDSTFSLAIRENDSLREFVATDYSSNRSERLIDGRYQYSLTGFLDSESLGGTVQLNTSDPKFLLQGNIGEVPERGFLQILGLGLERINLLISGFDLRLGVDFDGAGSTFSVVDETFFVSWNELLSRDFQMLDYVAD